MAYQFPETSGSGGWTNLTTLASIGSPITVAAGFLEDDNDNVFKGEAKPRFVVHGTVDGDQVKVAVGKGYSRDEKLKDLADFLADNPDETVSFKFVQPDPSSRYIDFEVVA